MTTYASDPPSVPSLYLRWLPWTLVLVAAVISSLEFIVAIQNNGDSGQRESAATVLFQIVVFLPPMTFSSVGAFVITQRPGNRIGWLMLVAGLGMALAVFTSDYPHMNPHTRHLTRPFADVVAWLSIWIGGVYLCALFLLLLLFPTGYLPSRKWRALLWLGLAGWVGLNAVEAVQRGPIDNGVLNNPFGIVSVPDAIPSIFMLAGLAGMLGAVLSLVVRFSSATGVARQQLKWFSYGACLAIIILLGGFATSWSNTVVASASLAAIAAIPLFVGIAILRYRLYDIDVLINRTLVYGSLSACLATIYLACVASFQTLFHAVIGHNSEPAIVISTLAIAALFHPLRRRIQSVIDRRFYRRKYDAAATLAAFQTRLRNEVDLDQLTGDVLNVLQNTVQPAHASLWLHGESGPAWRGEQP